MPDPIREVLVFEELPDVRRALTAQQRQEMLGEQHWSNRIDAKHFQHCVGLDACEAFLGLDPVVMEEAGCHDHGIDEAGRCHGLSCRANTFLIGKIAGDVLNAGLGR